MSPLPAAFWLPRVPDLPQGKPETAMDNTLGRYEILCELGRGSMGIIYKAADPVIGRLVALKSINLHGLNPAKRQEYEIRLSHEAKAAGGLNHPNIVTIYDMGWSDDTAYIAMELLDGSPLDDDMDENHLMPLDRTLEIAIQVAEALDYAHAHGIIHRDIKPSNIILTGEKHIKIADFGIARMESSLTQTKDGLVMGSPLYMSPEQITASRLDQRSDLFSFGVVLYQFVTGYRPFNGDNANSVMYQILNADPPPPSHYNPKIPAALDDIISRCLAKKPADRYQNAHELANDLRACLDYIAFGQVSLYRAPPANKLYRQLKRIVTPRALPQNFAHFTAYGGIGLIYMLQYTLQLPASTNLLYLFPLNLLSLHSDVYRHLVTATLGSFVLQAVTLGNDPTLSHIEAVSLGLLVPLAILISISTARASRIHFIETLRLATSDRLTGLPNRRSFQYMSELEAARQKRNGGLFSLVIITLSNLREINQSQGYHAGDEALRLLASILRDHIRMTDTAARIDGDEFAMLLPGTSAHGSEELCRQLATKIGTQMERAALPLRTRIGYITITRPSQSIAEVYKQAANAIRTAPVGSESENHLIIPTPM